MSQMIYLGYRLDPETGIVYGKLGKPFATTAARGYVEVHNGKTGFNMRAHRMIWEAVHGPIPDGMQVNHINGIKTDNRIANLELMTPSENTSHAYRIGLACAKGARNGRSIGKRRKLSEVIA